MTTTVTVKTAGHSAHVTVKETAFHSISNEFMLLPNSTREFVVTNLQYVEVRENHNLSVVYPQNTHASVV